MAELLETEKEYVLKLEGCINVCHREIDSNRELYDSTVLCFNTVEPLII